MEKLIFSTTASFGSDWLPELGLTYQQSEYHMQRISTEKQPLNQPELTLREASLDDLSILYDLDIACFPKQAVDMNARLRFLLDSPNCTIVLALYHGEVIGKAHIHRREGKISLSDIAIFPAAQGRGFGSELLAACINNLIDAGKSEIVLDVEANNVGALSLYTRQGFVTTNSYDYWVIGLRDLEKTFF
jgi:ribosomal protein S18 acetylase RimI-like enzyme